MQYISEIMTRRDDYNPDQNEILGWCVDYLKKYGLRYSASDLLAYFIEARILEKNNSQIRFRLRMFFEFFAATRMIDDDDFKAYIFAEERYLKFSNEIGFYSALHRRDKYSLERMFEKFNALTSQIWPDGSPIGDPNQAIKNVELPDKKTTDDELEQIKQSLRTPEQIIDDRKLLNNETNFYDGEQSQSVVRQGFHTSEEQWVGQLVLLSGMLKHMELIEDLDKRRILSGVLDGWTRFSVLSVALATAIAQEGKVVFNGVTYKSTLADDLSVGEKARRITLYMPIAVSRMATVFLGTEKLRLQLEEGIGSSVDPAPRQFLRLSILADLGVEGIAKIADKVARRVRGSGYLEHVFARKLYEVAVRFRLGKDDLDGLRSIVGDSFVQIGGKADTKKNSRKVSVINGLNRQRMQVDFFRKRSGD